MKRGLFWLILLCSVVGVLVSAELTWVHYKVHSDPAHRSVCAISQKMDCDLVAASPWASVLGVPNALWSVLAYLVLIALAWRARKDVRHPRFPRAPGAWLFWSVAGMAAYTAFLVAISFVALPSFCVFCAVLWVLNAVLLVAVLLGARQLQPVAGLRHELFGPGAAPLQSLWVLVPLAAVALTLMFTVPQLYPADARPGSGARAAITLEELPAGIHERGPADAAHVIVELTDYRCPFCNEAEKVLNRLLEAYPERLRVVHLHFPLEEGCNRLLDWRMHPGACESARIAECAGRQGHFWEMHDALFALEDPAWDPEDAWKQARTLGLDLAALQACVKDDAAVGERIAGHVDFAERLNAPGTPTWYLDGRLLHDPPSFEDLAPLIER